MNPSTYEVHYDIPFLNVRVVSALLNPQAGGQLLKNLHHVDRMSLRKSGAGLARADGYKNRRSNS
jgi:hypothetical protein